MKIRRARIPDSKEIHSLINKHAKKHRLVPKSYNDLYENIRDFFVCEQDGIICGVCALHVMWEDLAEIKSLIIAKEYRGMTMGHQLVRHALKDARALGIKKVFALTYIPQFFRKLGFSDIDKSQLPHKIWSECIRCSKFPECDEQAVIMELKG